MELIDIVSESFELGRECEETVDGDVVLNLKDIFACSCVSDCEGDDRSDVCYEIKLKTNLQLPTS